MKRVLPDNTTLADDLLRGASDIALELFGDAGQRARVYYLASRKSLPDFYVGNAMYARRTTLRAWIEQRERESVEAATDAA